MFYRTMVALLGGMRAGGAWCNVNLAVATETNVDILRRGRCEVLFFHSAAADKVEAFVEGIDTLRVVVCIDSGDHGHSEMGVWASTHSAAPLDLDIPPDALGCQGATGGTTGKCRQGRVPVLDDFVVEVVQDEFLACPEDVFERQDKA